MQSNNGGMTGVQRWKHAPSHGCRWHGTRPVGVEDAESKGIDQTTAKALHVQVKRAKQAIFVITAAQNATPVHKPFWAALTLYAKKRGATLLVVPYRYKNPTSMWSASAQDDDWWAPELAPHLLDRRTVMNPNLILLADIKTQPTASSPLTGFETITGERSAIIGHPKLELTTVPTPQSRMAKILTTTGACTVPNYLPSKAGKKGEFHHTFGACVVEIDGKRFHMRQINAVRDGSFIDLDTEYRPDGTTRTVRAAALVTGDEHEEFMDPAVAKATYGPRGIVEALDPKEVIHHDIHDFYSRNHHHRGEVFINLAKHRAGADDVRAGLQKTFAWLDSVSQPRRREIVVPSNHPDALARWVKETDPRTDLTNCVFWAETFKAMADATVMGRAGATTIDPFAFWGKRMLRHGDRVTFLARDESHTVLGIEVGMHGDAGPNGARGTRNGFTRIGVKSIVGHSHSPGIKDGVYQVGTSSRMGLEYQRGPSSWLHTHCVVYANGKRSLINIIDGKWRT